MSYRAKRRYQRAMFPARVIVHNDEEVAYLQSGTISEGGMSLTSPGPIFTPGTVLKLNIKSPDMPKTFLAEGEVISYLKNKREQNLCLKFINISDKDIHDIRRFVRANAGCEGKIKVAAIPEIKPSVPKPPVARVQQQLKQVAQPKPVSHVRKQIKQVQQVQQQGQPRKPQPATLNFAQIPTTNAQVHREIDNFDDFSSLIKAYDHKPEVTATADGQELTVKTEVIVKLPEQQSKNETQNVYCSPLKLPNERSFEVYLNGEKVPHSKINGWYFDPNKLLIKFSGRYRPTPGSIIQFGCMYDPD